MDYGRRGVRQGRKGLLDVQVGPLREVGTRRRPGWAVGEGAASGRGDVPVTTEEVKEEEETVARAG